MQKSSRGAAKRFKITAKGKVKHKRAYLRHKLSSKSETRKRNLRKHAVVADEDLGRIKSLLPFSF